MDSFCRKILREHQLEAVTKAVQQEELERRRRLDQQRKQDSPLPEYTTGENIYPESVNISSPFLYFGQCVTEPKQIEEFCVNFLTHQT